MASKLVLEKSEYNNKSVYAITHKGLLPRRTAELLGKAHHPYDASAADTPISKKPS